MFVYGENKLGLSVYKEIEYSKCLELYYLSFYRFHLGDVLCLTQGMGNTDAICNSLIVEMQKNKVVLLVTLTAKDLHRDIKRLVYLRLPLIILSKGYDEMFISNVIRQSGLNGFLLPKIPKSTNMTMVDIIKLSAVKLHRKVLKPKIYTIKDIL